MKTFLMMLVFVCAIVPMAQAQQRVNDGLADFYRPQTAQGLGVRLPPRMPDFEDHAGFEDNSGFFGGNRFSGNGGCPNEIQIGSVSSDTPVYGGVDIDVVITRDIVINCGGFR